MSLYFPAPLYTATHTTTFAGARMLIVLRIPIAVGCMPTEAWFTQDTSTASQQARFRIQLYATQGTSGTALTEEPHQTGFSTSRVTAVALPTTGNQSTSAVVRQIDRRGANVLGGGYEFSGWGKGHLALSTVAREIALETLTTNLSTSNSYTFGITWAELRGNTS